MTSNVTLISHFTRAQHEINSSEYLDDRRLFLDERIINAIALIALNVREKRACVPVSVLQNAIYGLMYL